jgi:hypothetical protein
MVAQAYFESAKDEALRCLGYSWKMTTLPSNHHKGLKVAFDNPPKGMCIAVNMVPTRGGLKSEWRFFLILAI